MARKRNIESLPEQIEKDLLDEMRQNLKTDRFPPEVEIADRYNVSRVTVRDALASLERKGIVIRKQGLGTFINRNALRIQSRLDESIDFNDLIRAAGFAPSVSESQMRIEKPEAAITGKLNLEADDEALIVQKVFSADDTPVIYLILVIPCRLISPKYRESILEESPTAEPFYPFFAERCSKPVEYQIARIKATAVDRDVARFLRYPPGASMLEIEQVGYSAQNTPIYYSREYHNTEIIAFELLRRPR